MEGTLKVLKDNSENFQGLTLPLFIQLKSFMFVFIHLRKYQFFPVVKQKCEHVTIKTSVHYRSVNAFLNVKIQDKPFINWGEIIE